MRRFGWIRLAIVLLALLGVASSVQAGDDKSKSEPPKKEAPAKGTPPPAGSKLAKVEKKMTQEQVRKIMGEPDNEKSYVTAKAFIPYQYGADSGANVEWDYKGVGRVIFTMHRWTNRMIVIRVDYDPTEKGD